MICGSPYVQTARNELIRKFIETDADVFFSLDDDISWNAEDAIKLIQMDDDFVAGIYRLKSDDQTDMPVVINTWEDGTPKVRISDGVISAVSVPAGFFAIKRHAIRSLIKAYPQNKYYDKVDGKLVENYDLFPQGVFNGRFWGEDFAFCRLWTQINGHIWVVPDITIKHYSVDGKCYTGNYHEYLKKLKNEGTKYDDISDNRRAQSIH